MKKIFLPFVLPILVYMLIFSACSKKEEPTKADVTDHLSKMPALEEETKDRFEDKMVDFILNVLKPEQATVRTELLRDPWEE